MGYRGFVETGAKMTTLCRTIVVFRSTHFNTTESRDYFTNPEGFGDDVCEWLIQGLKALGVTCDDEPWPEDFGWYFRFQLGEKAYCIVCAFRPGLEDEPGDWIVWLERSVGFFSSLFGGRNKGLELVAGEKIHEVLSRSHYVEKIRWHMPADFNSGNEEAGEDGPG